MREQDKFVQQVLCSFKESLEESHPHATPDVQRVIYCIHENIFKPELTVQWLIENCQIKNHNFSGKFRHYTGKGVKEYILYHRLEAAQFLITQSKEMNITLSEIGYEIGFMTYATFNRAFTRRFGVTPAKWVKGKLKG